MTDNRADMAMAILKTILAVNEADDGESYVDYDHTQEALILALASLMEAHPELATPLDIKKAAKAAGDMLREKIELMRGSFQKTGKRLWDGEQIKIN